jgi:aldose 1-epimerase
MLPYTNRLAGARFPWRGKEYKVRPVPGQAHGLHGLGHRQIWQIKSIGTRRVCLYLQHQADELEWPWSFSAQLEYEVSESGLQVRLSIRNDSSVAAPAILGWHPYIPAYWLASNDIRSLCSSVHDLGSDGLNYPNPACARPGLQQISVNLQVPGTLAMENWSSSWELRSGAGERWRLESDAAHLVHHVPADRSYACAEPITALPGSLRGHSIHGVEAAIALEPGHRRQLNCGLLAKVSSEERG